MWLGTSVWGPLGTRKVLSENGWSNPLRWHKEYVAAFQAWQQAGSQTGGNPSRPKVFCASLADVLEEWPGLMHDHKKRRLVFDDAAHVNARRWFPADDGAKGRNLTMDDVRARLFGLAGATTGLDWLFLTKRATRLDIIERYAGGYNFALPFNWWVGVSVENQKTLERAAHLKKVSAAVRFLSVEPMLEEIDFTSAFTLDKNGRPEIDWVIFGGESTQIKKARPCCTDWIHRGVEQCQKAGVKVFVKQLGSNPVVEDVGRERMIPLAIADKKGEVLDDWRPEIRVQEFPLPMERLSPAIVA